MPAHHGLSTTPDAAMVSDSVLSSAHVVGISQPLSANIVGEYQTSDFRLELFGGA